MNPNQPYQNQPRPRQQRMAQYKVVDEQHGGLVVKTFAYPSEWRASSKVMWNMQHTNLPAQVYAIAFNPEGVESFEFLPTQGFFWLEGNYGIVPIGQVGISGLMRMPPRPAPNALVELIIPRFRSDRQKLRIVGVHPVQNLWQATNDPPPQGQSESLMARIEYEERGRAIEEEFYGVCQWVPATLGALNWGFGPLFCFRAERGKLDQLRETFWQIAGSLQHDPQWLQLYNQIAQQLMSGVVVNNEAIVREIYRQSDIARQNMEYNDRLIRERNGRVADSVARTQEDIRRRGQTPYTPQDAFGDAMMGRAPVYDPNSAAGNYHYVDNNYLYHYTDNQGNYYSTNDPMDNPNHHRPGSWVEATPVKPNR